MIGLAASIIIAAMLIADSNSPRGGSGYRPKAGKLGSPPNAGGGSTKE
jgi:hypothetical protein